MSLDNVNEKVVDNQAEEASFIDCMKNSIYVKLAQGFRNASKDYENNADEIEKSGEREDLLEGAYIIADKAFSIVGDLQELAKLICRNDADADIYMQKVETKFDEYNSILSGYYRLMMLKDAPKDSSCAKALILEIDSTNNQLDGCCYGKLQYESCPEGFSLQEDWVIKAGESSYCCVAE